MSTSDERREGLLDRLILDIKALVLLQGSTGELEQNLQRKLLDSHDEEVRRFVGSLQVRRKPEAGRLLVIAVGELILSSLLVLVGTLTLIPTMVGITSPEDLLNYFVGQFYGSLGGSPFSQYTGLIEFVAGALMILAAFYTLRQAALSLKEARLGVKTGEG